MSDEQPGAPPDAGQRAGSETATFRALMGIVADDLARYVESYPQRPVQRMGDPARLRATVGSYTFESPLDAEGVLRACIGLLDDWSLHTTHPRYFGWLNPSTPLVTAIADAVVAVYNPQLALWETSPVGNEIERHLLRTVGERMGYEPGSFDGCFTSGGAEANLTAALLALTHRFPAYRSGGLRSLTSQPRLYASSEGHTGWQKVAQAVGIGRDALMLIPSSADGAMEVDVLRDRIARDRALGCEPFCVVATAGSPSCGAADDIASIAQVCAQEGVWLHADAAWGGAAIFTSALRPLISRIEAADSITFDPHKLASMPMGTGMFLTRHRETLGAAFGVDAAFAGDARAGDFYQNSMQWSRRFVGLRLFLALAVDGLRGVGERIAHQMTMADQLRALLLDEGWEVRNRTLLPVVCFTDAGAVHHPGLAGWINDRGKVWISDTHLPDGSPTLRACITSYRSGRSDIEALVHELRAARRESRSWSRA
jgi:aromatic-L-amino-acid/L-tryptophan decarboxylase